MGRQPIDAILVVVPVQNEEQLLRRCLEALGVAVTRVSTLPSGTLEVDVVLVLDSCDDGSAEIARLSPFHVITIGARSVGAARSAGIDAGLRRLSQSDSRRVWLANTDADSAVPPHWLSHQLALAESGVQLMIGTVRPDPLDLTSAQRAAWESTHVLGEANGHVHGANLGVRADVYLAAGGFAAITEHEDVGLVERIRATSAPEAATDECWVLTSGRPVGRTPGGYARHIREDLSASISEPTF
ncbi:glycosyltransferase family 2 protein [Glaciibacter psychrotolerans]|uniref:4,4'-diaponeurosporenoate glycosyltransferase n=1 Tax=Glaciibacter psychrotolerans TaxID=670054 RepID=A0A7Z0EFC8_9MICO|nr:glycosyltransferase [Leifsonia psychrotolerans]NYJ20591.1 glycosyltransferase involved in cell wall biosynthesis [Leifsonia psychrotolerans]